MATRGLLTAMLGLLLAAPAVRAQATQAPAKPPAQDTPESAFKSFFLALATGDEEALKRLTLPAEGFEWLVKGQHVPKEQAEEFRAAIIDKMVLKRLKAGDELKLPDGRVWLTIEPARVAEDRVVLMPEGAPQPTDVRLVEGVWRVDARPMIAGRKAADAARRRAEDAKKKAGP